jgi:hypothetical protein
MSVTRIDDWTDTNLFEVIRNELKLFGWEGDELFPYAAVLLAARYAGAAPSRLAEVTGYSRDFIDEIDNRMRAAGIWVGDRVDTSEGEYIKRVILALHTLVAAGAVVVKPGSMPRRYYPNAEAHADADPHHDRTLRPKNDIRPETGAKRAENKTCREKP